MERREEVENAARRRRSAKNKDQVPHPHARTLAPPPAVRPPGNEVKSATLAVDLNARLRSADMPAVMQERALRCTRALLYPNPEEKKKPSPTQIAMALKKEFDAVYGPAWHCIVGKSFGSFVTHTSGGFLYFSVDKLCFLLFKTQVRPIGEPSSQLSKPKSNA